MSATDLTNLTTRRAEVCARLAALGSLDNPNAEGSGHTIDRVGYRDSLYRELAEINNLIATLGGPWEITS